MDTISKEHRSWNMSRIKGKNTKPEIVVRKLLHSIGYRFRLHRKDLPGKPDIVLPKYKTVIFVNGCFWHRHEGCKYSSNPKTNVSYWEKKFAARKIRDIKIYEELKKNGWKVIIIWECEIGYEESIKKILENILLRREEEWNL